MTTAFWIADQPGYVNEATVSAASFKRHNPACQTVLLGNAASGFDEIIPLPVRQYPRWYMDSVRYFALALDVISDDKLIYFDVDTYTLAPLDDLIALIGRFDLIGSHAPARETAPSAMNTPAAFCEFNIGVLGIRNSHRMSALFDAWLTNYVKYQHIYGDNDQAPLRDTLYAFRGIEMYVLPPEYNCRFGFGGFAAYDVKVLHGRGMDFEQAAKAVNYTRGMRAWTGRDLHERI